MTYARSSQTNSARRPRGYTLIESLIAAGITLVALVCLGSTINMAGRMEQQVSLQSDASEGAALAMEHLVQDVREAKEVQFPTASRVRIYYPAVAADGRYDRFVTDYNTWVEYARTDVAGNPNAGGIYLWRSTNASVGRRVCTNVNSFQGSAFSNDSIQVSIGVSKTSGRYAQSTRLNQRVIFLRNF